MLKLTVLNMLFSSHADTYFIDHALNLPCIDFLTTLFSSHTDIDFLSTHLTLLATPLSSHAKTDFFYHAFFQHAKSYFFLPHPVSAMLKLTF
jgi:hypothetical protein